MLPEGHVKSRSSNKPKSCWNGPKICPDGNTILFWWSDVLKLLLQQVQGPTQRNKEPHCCQDSTSEERSSSEPGFIHGAAVIVFAILFGQNAHKATCTNGRLNTAVSGASLHPALAQPLFQLTNLTIIRPDQTAWKRLLSALDQITAGSREAPPQPPFAQSIRRERKIFFPLALLLSPWCSRRLLNSESFTWLDRWGKRRRCPQFFTAHPANLSPHPSLAFSSEPRLSSNVFVMSHFEEI